MTADSGMAIWTKAPAAACARVTVNHPIVETVWFISNPQTDQPTDLVRSGQLSTTVVINAPFTGSPSVGLICQRTHAVSERNSGQRLGLQLHPWTSHRATVQTVEVLARTLGMSALAGWDNPEQAITQATDALATLQNCPPRPRLVIDAVAALRYNPTRHTMRNFAKKAGVSQRTVRRRVIEHVGLTPDDVRRIARAQNARGVLAFSSTSLAVAAVEAGYCDQAHMTHQFTRICGYTPLGWRRHILQWQHQSTGTDLPRS